MNEAAIEFEIQKKGLKSFRLTPEMIDATIVNDAYHHFAGTTVVVCCLTLSNGYSVTGESACVSPSNFDITLGRQIARDNAREKIWQLEGYLCKEAIHKMKEE
jgi:hypothetical protein